MDARLKAKAMTDDQLDNVNGGTYTQSMEVANLLKEAGIEGTTKAHVFPNFDGLRKAISELGFECRDHGGMFDFGADENTYLQRSTGKEFTHAEFVDYLKQNLPGLQKK